jgi:hypothetical protein
VENFISREKGNCLFVMLSLHYSLIFPTLQHYHTIFFYRPRGIMVG